MRKFFVGCLVIFGVVCATAAVAADMPLKAPAAAPISPPVFNWNGIYIGGHVGYGWGTTDSDGFSLVTGAFTGSTSSDREGVFGGGQIGFNWVVVPHLLLGVEGDLSAANLTGTGDNCTATGCVHTDFKTDWFATLRGRLGLVMNNWLIYGTGGAVWTHSSNDRTIACLGAGCPAVSVASPLVGMVASVSGTHSGWTAGGGVEWGFAPHWTAKLEYLYFDVKSSNDFVYPGFAAAGRHAESETKYQTVRLGINYLFNWGS